MKHEFDKAQALTRLLKTRYFFSNYCLQQLHVNDAEELFALTDKNRTYLAQYLPWVNNVTTVQDTLNFINNAHREMSDVKNLTFAIRADKKIIGVIGFINIALVFKEGEVGYWIAEQLQGRGIVTAACKCLLDIGFNEIGLYKVFIKCHISNVKSQKVPLRLGFQELKSPFENKPFENDYLMFYLNRK